MIVFARKFLCSVVFALKVSAISLLDTCKASVGVIVIVIDVSRSLFKARESTTTVPNVYDSNLLETDPRIYQLGLPIVRCPSQARAEAVRLHS